MWNIFFRFRNIFVKFLTTNSAKLKLFLIDRLRLRLLE